MCITSSRCANLIHLVVLVLVVLVLVVVKTLFAAQITFLCYMLDPKCYISFESPWNVDDARYLHFPKSVGM